MNIKYVVETSAWLEYYFGANAQLKELIENNDVATTVITIGEIVDVFSREKADPKEFLRFIKSIAYPLPLTIQSATAGAEIKTQRRPKHHKFSLADGFHLAIARERKAVLVTCDTDFVGIDDVMLFTKN